MTWSLSSERMIVILSLSRLGWATVFPFSAAMQGPYMDCAIWTSLMVTGRLLMLPVLIALMSELSDSKASRVLI